MAKQRASKLPSRKKAYSIEDAFRALFETHDVFEVRALGCKADGRKPFVMSGYFDDFETAANAIEEIEAEHSPEGIYVTINPCHESVFARSPNEVEPYPEHTTSDKEIARRRHLMIDFDPVRVAGVSSTESELSHASERATKVAEY
jgi:hypothetical protein